MRRNGFIRYVGRIGQELIQVIGAEQHRDPRCLALRLAARDHGAAAGMRTMLKRIMYRPGKPSDIDRTHDEARHRGLIILSLWASRL
jgi:hypothetical protein